MSKNRRKGLVLVYTGDGKGKTTASLGTAFRALGYGWKVVMIQFIKGTWKYGEMETVKQFGENFEGCLADPPLHLRDCHLAAL